MWGDGGRVYWGRRPERGAAAAAAAGILVAFAWPSSSERDLEPFVELYESLGWSSLICHVDLLTLFLPEKATSLACVVLNKLLKEVRIRPVPIVLTAFSGGSKGCLYKVIQLIEGKCEGKLCLDEYHLVRDCMCGQIYDSSPVDFTTDLGTRFLLHPKPPRVVSWMARTVTSGLDALFLSRIETERAQYWQTLYSSVSIGPVLIFCSEDDELAPCQIISNFAQCLQEFGGDVKLVKWSSSPHVGFLDTDTEDATECWSPSCRKKTMKFEDRGKGPLHACQQGQMIKEEAPVVIFLVIRGAGRCLCQRRSCPEIRCSHPS